MKIVFFGNKSSHGYSILKRIKKAKIELEAIFIEKLENSNQHLDYFRKFNHVSLNSIRTIIKDIKSFTSIIL